jgi:thiamine pyrophosphokinase
MAAPGASDMVVVVTGGDAVDPAHGHDLPVGAPVIAVDSGVEHAQRLGLPIHLAIGDFDSVDPQRLAQAESAGAIVERHPVVKDATDLELALDAALALGPDRIHVLGGHGGRLDHLLGNLLVLAAPAYAAATVTARMGRARVTVVRGAAELTGPIGDLVSLLPVHGGARAITTRGLLYPLDGEDLPPGTTRGISNELVSASATVHLEQGVLVAVQPGELGTHHHEESSR